MAIEDIREDTIRAFFPPRRVDSHKGTYGHLLTVCGQRGMAGAAILCAEGALRTGAGLVTCAVPRAIYPIVSGAVPEATFCMGYRRLPLATVNAVVIGCGLGIRPSLLHRVLQTSVCPIVVDADGINTLSLHRTIRRTAKVPLILTPHPGEMARLLGTTTADIGQHRAACAATYAQKEQVVLVLKGYQTLVALPDGSLFRNMTGNPGMATGGSGDVLAGMIGGLLAQGLSPAAAALSGVYLHGAAGDAAAARLSQHGMLPRDLLDEVPFLFRNWE